MEAAHLGRFCRLFALRCGGFVARSQPALLCFKSRLLRILRLQSCLLHVRPTAFGAVFLTVDRPHMRRVSIAIRTPDPKLLLVRINPLPQLLAPRVALHTGLALDAHEIDRKPVAVAAAAAPAMV